VPDIQLAEKKTVLQILESFKGTGPLRELLAQLNYDPLNEPVSRKEWPEPAQVALAQDPRLYGRVAGEFYVVYAQLAADKLKLQDERTVISQLLKQYPYALFVFSDKTQTNFHFVNVKWENNQKRRLFRRITVGPQERMRTAAERLSMLDIQTIDAGLFGVTAQHIQDRHDEAFDVAKVSKSFFDEYKRVFEVMRDAVKGFGTSDEEQDRRHLFTQRLFNRLMFLRFIQKKGWLTIDGSTDYLASLWASHGKLKQDGKNFYTDRLRLLFAALNNERAGIVLQGGGGTVEATIGKVKYLNGGLFEETAEDKDPTVRIADAPFKQIFDKADGLFEIFNFTITESTPLDIEIAVDPEMLGKIFEELVTGRHDSGSYYTPKPIVSFMCREALKGYLETRVPDEDKRALARFIDKHEPDEVRNAEAVLNALRRVTVCDPACGSGAYLLGMMHELLDLRQCLFQTRQVDNKTMYQRKLDIIQTNIYGVDIAEFAVNIARLRLWLSLAVDYDGPEPQPLPNLDYKIEIGDSVCSPSPGAMQMGLAEQFVKPFATLKGTYLTAHHADKAALRKQVDDLRETILGHACPGERGFIWAVDFAEVFGQEGFDVVIANPPYVNAKTLLQGKGRQYKNLLSKQYLSAVGLYDLYVVFWELALRLVNPQGSVAFIIPNKIGVADYAEQIRKIIAAHSIRAFADVSNLHVFGETSVYPVIAIVGAQAPLPGHQVLILDQLADMEDFQTNPGRRVNQVEIFQPNGRTWALRPSDETMHSTLAEVATVHGGIAGYSAQALLEALSEGKNGKHSIPFIVTANIDPFVYRLGRVRYMKNAFDNPYVRPNFDAISEGKWALFQQEKIVIAGMTKVIEAAISTSPLGVGVAVYSVTDAKVDPYYLLGILNSSYVSNWYRNEFEAKHLEGGYLSINKGQLEKIPVPHVSTTAQAKLATMVKQIISSSGDDFDALRMAIDDFVNKLYAN
jgi:methylase of polypeptide subunit release factors